MRWNLLLSFALLLSLSAFTEDTSIRSKDVGSPTPGSTTAVGEDGYDVKGGGKDIWFHNDAFRFVYCQLDGDFDVRVKVTELTAVHEWTKAGLMARVSLLPDAEHVSVIMSGGGITQVMQRSEKASETTGRTQSATFPGVTLRLVRKGGALTAYRTTSPEGGRFEKISDALALPPGPLFVGMCLVGHNEPNLASAKFREFSMAAMAGGKDPLSGLASSPKNTDTATGETKVIAAARVDTPADETPIARPAAPQRPVDSATATALAMAAGKLAEGGKLEQARENLYKSLAHDPNCGEALYELGKLFEKDGQLTAAGNFLALASRELLRVETDNPAAATKRKDADRRVLALNPAAAQMRQAMADYSDELAQITRKLNDALTHDEVSDRIQSLSLERYVGTEKLPKTPNRTMAAASKPAGSGSSSSFSSARSREVAASPDIEKALKAAGWQTVTGSWKKISDNVYEVTDGRLEAKFKNGLMQAVIHNTQTSKGTVRMLVRNGHGSSSYSSSLYTYDSGYGLSIDKTDAVSLIPYGLTGSRFIPIQDKGFKLDYPTKNQCMVTVTGTALEFHVNGKRVHKSNYTISDEGPFIIELKGTVTIENPQVKGN